MMKRFQFLAGGGLVVALAAGLLMPREKSGSLRAADESASDPKRKADVEAIRKVSGEFQRAFEKGDAAAAAALVTSGAELIPDDTEPLRGRETIKKALTEHFAKSPRVKIGLEVESLRFTSRDSAIEEGHMTTTPEKGEPSSNRYSILYVREDGKWFLAFIKEWPSEQASLRDLDWLIGTWVAKRDDAEVRTTYEWFGNKSYIRATFMVHGKERSFSGMQMIGADPDSGELFTRTFEIDGGYGEGTCRREGNKWIFETETTLGDGSVLSATNILVRVDKDTFTWQPVNVTIDEEPMKDVAPVKVMRAKN